MIRPWYRSRLFWLGLPGLLFLLWAWASSNFIGHILFLPGSQLISTQGKLLWWKSGSNRTYDVQLDGRTCLVTVTTIEPDALYFCGTGLPTTGDIESYPIEPGEECWFPAPRWQSVDLNAATYYRLLALPYWLLIAGYGASLAGGAHWWQRRKVRLLKASSAEGVELSGPRTQR